MDNITKEIIENEKPTWFINHIKEHLKEGEQVICKICGKSIDEIAEDKLNQFREFIKKE